MKGVARPALLASVLVVLVVAALLLTPVFYRQSAIKPPRWEKVEGWREGRLVEPATEAPRTIARLESIPGGSSEAVLFRLSLEIGTGTTEARLVGPDGTVLHARRISLLGANRIYLAGPGALSSYTIDVVQPGRTGPVDVTLGELARTDGFVLDPAIQAMRDAEAFERETGRLADPAVGNLVPNADFKEDDEVRGAPKDWLAYVATERDAASRTLLAAGAPMGRRPYLAAGPVRLEAGRRYRALARLEVLEGEVVVKAVDYDETADIGRAEPVLAGEGLTERVFEIDGSRARAARLWFAPPAPGAPARFVIHAVQLELLPEVTQ